MGGEPPIKATLVEHVRSLDPSLEDEWRKWVKDSLPEGSWGELKARCAPRSWSGPALAGFLGLVYGASVPDNGIPTGVAWIGRRAALAVLINRVRSRDGDNLWPSFLAAHGDRAFRCRGNGPKRRCRGA